MSNTILLKRSDVANSVPLAGNLVLGEMALNYADGNLFFKDATSNVVLLTSTQFVDVPGNISGGNIDTSGQITAVGNISGNYFIGNGSQLSGINAFSSINVTGQDSIVANSISDSLTFAGDAGIAILANATTNTITISSTSSQSIFATGGTMGLITSPAFQQEDLGLIIDSMISQSYNLGTIITVGLFYPDQLVLPSYTVSQLGNLGAFPGGQMVFCTNDSGGPVPAFSDGTNWRRVTDRAIVS
jgi:hypothetical protein